MLLWAVPAATLVFAWLATGLVLRWLERRAILDHPNERSSHARPTPRGGGLAVTAAVAVAWLVAGVDEAALAVLLLALVVAAISWLDDLRGLPAAVRFAVQAAAVAGGVLTLPDPAAVLQGLLPGWLAAVLIGVGWLWFVNLYNFMDGIDGLAGVETAAIAGGVAVVALLGAGTLPAALPLQASALAAAAIGFLGWNWPPARIFLGDIGSVTLGYLLGWLLLLLAAGGDWAAALLLPLYHLADATLTLLRRLARGEAVWRPHRQHFYQQAARRFGSHRAVVERVLVLDLALVLLAVAASLQPALAAPALAAGGLIVAWLLWYFADATAGDPDVR